MQNGLKKIPLTLDKKIFIKILNDEKNLQHKCWLLLAYCSGLRAEEVGKIELANINAGEHKLKILGKRKKERFTVLPDITIEYLRLYYKNKYFKRFYPRTNETGYLFEGASRYRHKWCNNN